MHFHSLAIKTSPLSHAAHQSEHRPSSWACLCAAANGTNADVDHLGLVLHITEVSDSLEQQAKACAAMLGTTTSAPAGATDPSRGEGALGGLQGASGGQAGASPGQEDDRKRKGRATKKQTAAERAAEKKAAEAQARAALESRWLFIAC